MGMLDAYNHELRLIFDVYAALDTSGDAADRLTTINITEFKILLRHCGVLEDKKIGNAMIDYIFDQIQHDASETGEAEEDGEADDEELSFSEFVDGMIALVMYRSQNPFDPLPLRLE